MNEFISRPYTYNEVSRIIRRALKQEPADTISHQDLIETAREIGIDSQILESVILQERREFEKESMRKARLKRRKMGLYSHLWSYLMVNAALLVINYFTPGSWWFQWPLLGWGIGLAFQFKAVYFPFRKEYAARLKSKHLGKLYTVCGHKPCSKQMEMTI